MGIWDHRRSTANAARHALLAFVVLGAAVGCDTLRDLRASLRGEEGGEALGTAKLRVEVEPADGITVLLDGVRVASMSPYTNEHVTAGRHTLEVRAMGYHPFALPLVLGEDEAMTIPVALRRRPAGNPEEPAARPPTKEGSPPAAPAVPDQAAPKVPVGVKPIPLRIAPSPKVDLSLDGVAISGRELTLERINGTIGVGPASLPYRIGGRGLLFYTVPGDGAAWSFDGQPLAAGARFKHHKGVARIERVAADGKLSILIKR